MPNTLVKAEETQHEAVQPTSGNTLAGKVVKLSDLLVRENMTKIYYRVDSRILSRWANWVLVNSYFFFSYCGQLVLKKLVPRFTLVNSYFLT